MAKVYKSLGVVSDQNMNVFQARPTAINNYDTMQRPIGTQYQVPAGQVLTFGEVVIMASAAGTMDIGSATAAIADGAGPPAGAVDDLRIYYNAAGLFRVPVSIPIAATRYPYLRLIAGGLTQIWLLGETV